MKKQTKSKLILGIILVAVALTPFNLDEFNKEYVDDKPNSLRATLGDWDPRITQSAGDTPRSVFIGDANNDGYNDIATANSFSNDVSILLWNNASGDWDPQIRKPTGSVCWSIFIGDANNDGYNDIAIASTYIDKVTIFLWNDSIEDWDGLISRSVGDAPYSVFIGDANNDGYNDIVTANRDSADVSILLWNNASGDWDPQITRSVGNGPYGVFIGDANNDGYNDIATANYQAATVSILLWNSTLGDWDPQITRAAGNGPYGVFIGDANNDGYNDIATSNVPIDSVSIFLWNSTLGDWDPRITRSVGDGPYSVFIGDANNDGYNDIATANTVSDDISILLWNSTLGDWDPGITRSAGDGPQGVFIGDANNDGYVDIATANSFSNDVSIFLWTPAFISIISPENKTYGALKGYYPATYGFDNDEEGENPRGWSSIENGGTIKIITNFNDHNKVVQLNDTSQINGTDLRITINDLNEGIIEFWMGTDNVSELNEIDIWDTDDSNWGIQLSIQSSKFQYKQGDDNWYDIPNVGTPMNDTLHHWSIRFNCTTHTFHVFIDSIDSGELSFKFPHDSFDRFQFHTSTTGAGFCMYADAVGFSWDSAYEMGDNLQEGMRLSYDNNTRLDWIVYSLDGSDNKTIFEQEIIPLPEDGPHAIQLFGRDAESGEILESEIRFFSVDTKNPEIIINSPIDGEVVGYIVPKYNISITEPHLESIWYTLDGGINNFTIDKLNGFIDPSTWFSAPYGPITISFYAKDILNNTNYEDVLITKTRFLSIDIVNQSFSISEFRIDFSVYNESSEAIDFATFQIWWNGIDVSDDVVNLGNGLYSVPLEPITVAPNEEPILLNMTVSADGYKDFDMKIYLTEIDSDNDLMPDWWEILNFLNPRVQIDMFFDFDGDGLTNVEEYFYQTNPNLRDSDNDGYSDGAEVAAGTDPLDINSHPSPTAPEGEDILLELSILIAGIAIAVAIVILGVLNRARPSATTPPKKILQTTSKGSPEKIINNS